MNRYEKIAWFTLAVTTISVVTYVIMFALLAGRIGAALAAAVALSSFSLLALIAFTPQLFNRQDLGPKFSIDGRGKAVHLSYPKIVIAAVLFSIVIACVVLFTILLRIPSGNGPMQNLALALKIFLPILLISFLVVVIMYLK